MRQSHTAVLARNETWSGDVATEPYEVAWAHEAIVFLRALEPATVPEHTALRVQISPDGMHWCDEGSTIALTGAADVPSYVRVRHFGGWLRVAGRLPEGVAVTVIAYLVMKG